MSLKNIEIVEALLKHKANPNQELQENFIGPEGEAATGMTPLLAAADKGELRIVNALLKHGANPNIAVKEPFISKGNKNSYICP